VAGIHKDFWPCGPPLNKRWAPPLLQDTISPVRVVACQTIRVAAQGQITHHFYVVAYLFVSTKHTCFQRPQLATCGCWASTDFTLLYTPCIFVKFFCLKIVPTIRTIKIFFNKCTQCYNTHDIRKLLHVSAPMCHLKGVITRTCTRQPANIFFFLSKSIIKNVHC
jgi:hypothetical protein